MYAVIFYACSSNSSIVIKNRGISCIYYRDVIGNIQVVFRAKMKVVLRCHEDPRVIKDLSNSDSLASRWNEQAVY